MISIILPRVGFGTLTHKRLVADQAVFANAVEKVLETASLLLQILDDAKEGNTHSDAFQRKTDERAAQVHNEIADLEQRVRQMWRA